MLKEKVIVLGAGIQGTCAALALQQKGYAVTLVDQAPDCMLRTSLVNEGRIHLGLLYASDDSFETSRLMLEAALQFAPLLEDWVHTAIDWADLRSKPFTYVVLPDSMHPPEEVLEHYQQLNQLYQAHFGKVAVNYLGEIPASLWQEAPAPAGINPDLSVAAVSTPEVSIDRLKFREIMSLSILAAEGINPLYKHRVVSVTRTQSGFRVEGTTSDGARWQRESGLVVNCLWQGRLEIDQQLGLAPERPWVYRLKYRVLGELPQHLSGLPSLSFVQGPFGDIVTDSLGSSSYLSWYPCCLQGWCTEITTPPSWEGPCKGIVDTATADAIAVQTLEALDAIVPGLAHCRVEQVNAGIIFAWGQTDIDNPGSELHCRSTVGVKAEDGYYSINTGKYTTAPLFASRLLGMMP